jgi:quercetin dioxygenase-like cupin family protein
LRQWWYAIREERKGVEANWGGAIHLLKGEGHSLWLAGELYTEKAVGKETGGAFALAEATTPAGGGPPPHIHHREDEAIYVLEGELEFMVEGETIKAGAGSFLYVPRGTLHTYRNVGTGPARYLGMVTPAGLEKFFEEVGVPTATSGKSSPPPFEQEDVDRLLAVAPKYGLEILSPPSEP